MTTGRINQIAFVSCLFLRRFGGREEQRPSGRIPYNPSRFIHHYGLPPARGGARELPRSPWWRLLRSHLGAVAHAPAFFGMRARGSASGRAGPGRDERSSDRTADVAFAHLAGVASRYGTRSDQGLALRAEPPAARDDGGKTLGPPRKPVARTRPRGAGRHRGRLSKEGIGPETGAVLGLQRLSTLGSPPFASRLEPWNRLPSYIRVTVNGPTPRHARSSGKYFFKSGTEGHFVAPSPRAADDPARVRARSGGESWNFHGTLSPKGGVPLLTIPADALWGHVLRQDHGALGCDISSVPGPCSRSAGTRPLRPRTLPSCRYPVGHVVHELRRPLSVPHEAGRPAGTRPSSPPPLTFSRCRREKFSARGDEALAPADRRFLPIPSRARCAPGGHGGPAVAPPPSPDPAHRRPVPARGLTPTHSGTVPCQDLGPRRQGACARGRLGLPRDTSATGVPLIYTCYSLRTDS